MVFGFSGGVDLEGSAVLVGYSLSVGGGGEFGGVAVGVGLDSDCGGLTNGVVEGEGDGFNHGVVDYFIVGLLHDSLAASATHCKQGKRRYEGSRYSSVSHLSGEVQAGRVFGGPTVENLA